MFRAPEVTMLTVGIALILSLWIQCASAADKSEENEQGERWAPQEIRIDDMLRKHFLKSRMKNNFVTSRSSSPSAHALRDAEEFEDVNAQYGLPEYAPVKRTYYRNDMRSKMLDLAKQRLRQKHEKRPSDVHPLNVGMGKSTSSMAWDALAGILADEYTKQEQTQPSHELRFIGK